MLKDKLKNDCRFIQRHFFSKKNSAGFTLVELLVVISVIGFLASASIVAFNNARIKARDTKRKAEVVQIQKALNLYADNQGGIYPDTTGGTFVYGFSYLKCLGKATGASCFAGRFSGLDSLNNSLVPFIKIAGDPKRNNEIFDNYLYSRSCHVSHAPGWGDKPCIYWQPEGEISNAACSPGFLGFSGGDICGYSCSFCTLRIGD